MIKIIRGRYGPKLLGPGTILNLSQDKEESLIRRKIAIAIEESKEEMESEDELQYEIKSQEEIEKIRTKKELIKYAKSIGLHELQESDNKEVLVNAIINYQEENLEIEESK